MGRINDGGGDGGEPVQSPLGRSPYGRPIRPGQTNSIDAPLSTQQICCAMIPSLVDVSGAPFEVLPPGIHWATLAQVGERFAYNERRTWLFEGVVSVARVLSAAGCVAMYLDGSFVTSKDDPADFDGCWEAAGVKADLLDPVLLDFGPGRKRQKRVFRGEMFISAAANSPGSTFLDFFQVEKHTGAQKGIVGIQLVADEADR